MMVIGADPHKREHAAAAVCGATGELRSSEVVAASPAGPLALLGWARALDSERIWAIEDRRHVSGVLERFLSERGERDVRVAAKLMGQSRSRRANARQVGCDRRARGRASCAGARAPTRCLQRTVDDQALEIKLLLDHREDLVGERTRIQNRLRWHLHELWPEFESPPVRLTARSGSSESAAGSRAQRRACACASAATSCAACAS